MWVASEPYNGKVSHFEVRQREFGFRYVCPHRTAEKRDSVDVDAGIVQEMHVGYVFTDALHVFQHLVVRVHRPPEPVKLVVTRNVDDVFVTRRYDAHDGTKIWFSSCVDVSGHDEDGSYGWWKLGSEVQPFG